MECIPYFCFYRIGRDDLGKNKICSDISRVRLSRKQVDLAFRV